MYNNVYQEYINNIIGTSPRNQMDYEGDMFTNVMPFNNFQNTTNMELEKLYPDLYKLLYPMIQAACMRNTKPITAETLDEMTQDIYSNFNADDVNILNINLTNAIGNSIQTSDSKLDRSSSHTASSTKTTSKTSTPETRNTEAEGVRNTRQKNYVLNDLIRILLIRELLGRPGNFPPNRPGFPPPPPPRPGGRPPFRPRDIQSQDYSLYEQPEMYSNYLF